MRLELSHLQWMLVAGAQLSGGPTQQVAMAAQRLAAKLLALTNAWQREDKRKGRMKGVEEDSQALA